MINRQLDSSNKSGTLTEKYRPNAIEHTGQQILLDFDLLSGFTCKIVFHVKLIQLICFFTLDVPCWPLLWRERETPNTLQSRFFLKLIKQYILH